MNDPLCDTLKAVEELKGLACAPCWNNAARNGGAMLPTGTVGRCMMCGKIRALVAIARPTRH